RVRELRDALQDVRDALEEVDRRRTLLDDANGNFLRAHAAAVRADDELAREDVLFDEARTNDVEQRHATEGLQAVRVGSAEAEEGLEHPGVRDARDVADDRAVVFGALGELGADDQIGFARLEDLHRAAVKVGVAEVDLVANHELAAREQDPLLERLA